jgi:3-hydroxyisobutyrate dehydrogenase
VPLDLASMTNQTYIAAKAAYGGEAQSPMIAKLLEDLLGTDLRAPGLPGAAGMTAKVGRPRVKIR